MTCPNFTQQEGLKREILKSLLQTWDYNTNRNNK